MQSHACLQEESRGRLTWKRRQGEQEAKLECCGHIQGMGAAPKVGREDKGAAEPGRGALPCKQLDFSPVNLTSDFLPGEL